MTRVLRGVLLRAALILAGVLVAAAPSMAGNPVGRWAGTFGLVQTSDGDAPITGSLGYEATGWYVLSPKWDAGFRLQSLSFDSDGMKFDEAPYLQPGSGTVMLASFALRYYPLGSDRVLFPFLGVAAGTSVSDSFDADRLVIPDVGFILDTDWDIDSFGLSAELGVRWDFSGDRWFLETGLRCQSLGATSIGIIDVPPTIRRTREVTTNLDSMHFALLLGRYF